MIIRLNKDYFSLTRSGGAYLIGLFATQGIIYAFKISNTYINIELVLAFIICAAIFITQPAKIVSRIKNTEFGLKLYLFSIIISIVYLVILLIQNDNIRYISFFNGLISLGLSLCVYYSVLSMEDYRNALLTGLWHGLILNLIISLIQYFAFKSGSYFTLYSVFPQNAFYISIPWDVAQTGVFSNVTKWLIYEYRALGLFLECSYFIATMTIIVLIRLSHNKRNTVFANLIILTLSALIIISKSGNLVIYILSLFIFVITAKRIPKKKPKLTSYKVMRLLIISIVTISIILVVVLKNKSVDFSKLVIGFNESISGANITDKTNTTRLNFMLDGLRLYLEYPLGIGYNMSSGVLQAIGNSYATFNYFIKVLLETGPFGFIAYVYFVGSNIYRLYFNNLSLRKKGLAIALLAMWVFQFANGTGFTPIAWVLLAICRMEKDQKESL